MKSGIYFLFLLFLVAGCRKPIDADHPEYLGTWSTYGDYCFTIFEFHPDGHGYYTTSGNSGYCDSKYNGNAKYGDKSITLKSYCFKIIDGVESVDTFFTKWPMPIGQDTVWCDKKMTLKKPITLSGYKITIYHWKE